MSGPRRPDPFRALDRLRTIINRAEENKATLTECYAVMTAFGGCSVILDLPARQQKRYDRLVAEFQPLIELWARP